MRATSSDLAYLCSTISFEFSQSGESSCYLISTMEKYLYMGMELTKIIEYFCVVRKEHIKLLDEILRVDLDIILYF